MVYKPYWVTMNLFGFNRQTKRYVGALIDAERRAESILDAGCGTGAAGMTLSDMFPKAYVLFTDINKEMLSRLKEKLPDGRPCMVGISDISDPGHVVMLNGEKVAIGRHTFDIINASANIGYSSNPVSTIATLYEALKPGGVIIDLEMNHGFWGRLISWIYGYTMLRTDQISDFLNLCDAKISKKRISLRYFPLNVTRECILIEKPTRTP